MLTQAASIHPYFPFVRVEVAADIVLFRPRLGMRLGAQRRAWAGTRVCTSGGSAGAPLLADLLRPAPWGPELPEAGHPLARVACTHMHPSQPRPHPPRSLRSALSAAVGTVNKVGADYVGLLVLGFMNAAIAADAIRPEFRPRLAVSPPRCALGPAARAGSASGWEAAVQAACAPVAGFGFTTGGGGCVATWLAHRAASPSLAQLRDARWQPGSAAAAAHRTVHQYLACLEINPAALALMPAAPPAPLPCLAAPAQEHCWASSKAAAHRLEVGTKVHFDVAAVRHHGAFVSIAGSLQQPGTGADGFAKPPKRPTEAAGGGKQQRRKQAAAQQQQQQQQTQAAQQQHVQAEQPSGKKDKKKKKEKRAQEAAPVQQQQQQQERPVAPQEAAASKKAKKSKQQGDHAAAAPALQAPTAAAGPAADGTRKNDKSEKKEKKKDKKRKANDAQTPAAAAAVAAAPNSSSELKPQRKKKKRMANA